MTFFLGDFSEVNLRGSSFDSIGGIIASGVQTNWKLLPDSILSKNKTRTPK